MERANEWQAIAKTTKERMADAIACIREIHTYAVAEIIATPIVDGDAEYFKWIADQVDGK